MSIEKVESCKCAHHVVTPSLIILIGLVFLLGNLNIISENIVSISWPILVALIGVSKMFKGMCKCCIGGCHFTHNEQKKTM